MKSINCEIDDLSNILFYWFQDNYRYDVGMTAAAKGWLYYIAGFTIGHFDTSTFMFESELIGSEFGYISLYDPKAFEQLKIQTDKTLRNYGLMGPL